MALPARVGVCSAGIKEAAIEFRQLRYFIAVAEELHFSRAAARLHLAQPALSQQIRNLERQLGVTLLDRSPRSVTLTSAGLAVLEESRRTLRQLELAVDRTRRAARGELGHLTIGFIGSAGHALIPAAMRRFRGARPGVGLELEEMALSDQFAGFRESRMDVAFVRMPIYATELATAHLGDEPAGAIVPVEHPLARRARISLDELAGDAWIFPARALAPSWWDEWQQRCAEYGFVPKVAATPRSVEAIVGLVASGAGVTALPLSTRALPRAGVAAVPVDALSSSVAIAWRPDRESALVRDFVELAVELAQSRELESVA